MKKSNHQSLVTEQFGAQAHAYLSSAVHAQGEDLIQLVKLIGAHPKASGLDLGCGGGHVSYLLAPLLRCVTAYDLSDEMLATVRCEALRRGIQTLATVQGHSENLPFMDASFDRVVSRYSVHHWDDAQKGLIEAHRVLKPDGSAIFIDVVSPGAPLLDTWLQSFELLRDPSHVRNYSTQEWKTMLQNAGFKVGRAMHFRLRLEFSSWVTRMNTPKTHIEALRSLQARAGSEVVDHFEIEADGSFTLDTMLIQAVS